MVLIKCEECGKEISDKATSCPHFGIPNSKQQLQNIRETLKIDNASWKKVLMVA